MRIAFAINGTRGDVQPAMVLAHALRSRGHDVRLGVPPNLVDFASAAGVAVTPFGPDTKALMAQVAQERACAGRNPLRRIRAAAAQRDRGWSELVADMGSLVEGADAIVAGFITEQPALVYCEKLGVPLISLHHAPIRPNSVVGPIPAVVAGPRITRAAWTVVKAALSLATRSREKRLRKSVGVPRLQGTLASRIAHTPGVELQLYDPLFSIGDDPIWRNDSRRRTRPVVGFVEVPPSMRKAMADNESESDLVVWIEAGTPPVYVGFGSMPIADGTRVRAAVGAAVRLGFRVLLCAGWNDIDAGTAMAQLTAETGAAEHDIRIVADVDHEAIFPRCSVIIHHGGAGTTAAALRAGCPSVICWYGSDQPWWGRELARRGAGMAMSYKNIDTARLEDELRAAAAPNVVARARDISVSLMSGDDALQEAVRSIENAVPRTTVVADSTLVEAIAPQLETTQPETTQLELPPSADDAWPPRVPTAQEAG